MFLSSSSSLNSPAMLFSNLRDECRGGYLGTLTLKSSSAATRDCVQQKAEVDGSLSVFCRDTISSRTFIKRRPKMFLPLYKSGLVDAAMWEGIPMPQKLSVVPSAIILVLQSSSAFLKINQDSALSPRMVFMTSTFLSCQLPGNDPVLY